jgi:PqqD family protein of HPr-rel-A system
MEFASLRVIALPDCWHKVTTVTTKWRIDSMGRFYDPAEDTVVYFDSHSGDTHLLSDFAAYILQQLDDQPLTTEELVNRISPAIGSSDIPELTMAVSGVLEELVALEVTKRE